VILDVPANLFTLSRILKEIKDEEKREKSAKKALKEYYNELNRNLSNERSKMNKVSFLIESKEDLL
jgi:hypothetical protein